MARIALAFGMLVIFSLTWAREVGAQPSADSVDVYRAALGAWAANTRLSHPSGRAEGVCIETLPDFIVRDFKDIEVPPLLPQHAEVIGQLLIEKVGVDRTQGCHVPRGEGVRAGMIDEAGRPAIRLMVSGLMFETPDSVLIHVGMLAGGLWGSGNTCRWLRMEDGSWERGECPGPAWNS